MTASEPEIQYALSIKQPWATLVLMGAKSVEIRKWSTPLRDRILIHTGKISDDRPEGWAALREEWLPLTEFRGGLIGEVDLVDCVSYTSSRSFTADRQLHRNDPTWFRPPVLYGFRFENPIVSAFRPYLGQVRMFPVVNPVVKTRKRRLVRPPGR